VPHGRRMGRWPHCRGAAVRAARAPKGGGQWIGSARGRSRRGRGTTRV